MYLPKVSAIMCTYRRFECVERSVNFFINQTYPNKELIIFNTDTEYPYKDTGCLLQPYNILIINNAKDFITNEPYNNVGAIRRDALKFASGKFVVTWDDDDVYMPYFMKQAVDRIEATGLPSSKPKYSMFHHGGKITFVQNTLEASVVAKIDLIQEYGYDLHTGKEGLKWYTEMRDKGILNENDENTIPSYCFDWGSGHTMKAEHKQSGDIDNPQNFENHKIMSKDIVCDRIIQIYDDQKIRGIYAPYYQHIVENHRITDSSLLITYLPPDIYSGISGN